MLIALLSAWAGAQGPDRGREARIQARQQGPVLSGDSPLRKVLLAEGSDTPTLWVRRDEVVFANGKSIALEGNARAFPFREGVVRRKFDENRFLSFEVFDRDGKLRFRQDRGNYGGVFITDDGHALVDDYWEMFGSTFELYSQTGSLVSTIQPFPGGYQRQLVDSHDGRILIYAIPSDPQSGPPKLLLIRASDGAELLDRSVDLPGGKVAWLGSQYFVLYGSEVVENRRTRGLGIFTIDGQPLRVIDVYVRRFVVDEAKRRLVVCSKDSVKQIGISDGETRWEVPYATLYTPPTMERPADIRGTFKVYPHQLRLIPETSVVAVLLAQSSPSIRDPQYRAELVFLDMDDGSVIERRDLGPRNERISLAASPRRLSVVRDDAFESFDVR